MDGMQAEYALIPHADFTAHALPASVPFHASSQEDAYVMASDILPTSWEIGLRSGKVPPDATIAIVGAGPVGLAGILSVTAMDKASGRATQRRIFAIDLNPSRLETAAKMGATDLIHNKAGDAVDQVMALTDNKGVDFVVECIGLPVGWDISQDIVAMGGQISILGVHGKSGTFKLEKLWQHNVSIHTGMVHCNTIPYFLERIEQGHVDADSLISHRFNLSEMEQAYDHFKNADQTSSLKVLITNDFE
jgi:alcohol dehydrogenase